MHSTADLRYVHPMLYQPTDIACTEHQTNNPLTHLLVGRGHESISSPSFWSRVLHLPAVKLNQSCTFSLLVASKHGLLSQNQGKSIVQKSEAEVERIPSRSSPNLQTLLSFPVPTHPTCPAAESSPRTERWERSSFLLFGTFSCL